MKKYFIILFLFITCRHSAAQWILNYQTQASEIIEAASSSDINNFWFITNFDRLYKTDNGGMSWIMVPHGTISFIPSGLFLLNHDTAFKTASASVWRTFDGGNNWTPVFSNSGNEIPCVWMKNNSDGIISFGGQLFKTTDCGNSWNASLITQPPLQMITSSGKGTIYSSGDNLWAAQQNSGIAYSSDFGISWTLPSNSGLNFTSTGRIFFGSPQFGLAINHNSSFVYLTTNGGNNWRQSDNSLGFNEDVAVNNSHCWYIPNPFDHFYIKYSNDSGALWTQQITDGSGFIVLEKSRNGNILWAGTTTGKVYKYTDQISTSIPDLGNKTVSFELKQNYPNPFNPTTNIQYDLPSDKFVTIKIYNILGKEVMTLVNEFKNAGSYIVSFNASNLSSGIYYYRIEAGSPREAGNFEQIKQMIFIK